MQTGADGASLSVDCIAIVYSGAAMQARRWIFDV
jgi:hypothetical protein